MSYEIVATREVGETAKVGGCMTDSRGPSHEEDGISRVICYLLGMFSVGICVALLVIVDRF